MDSAKETSVVFRKSRSVVAWWPSEIIVEDGRALESCGYQESAVTNFFAYRFPRLFQISRVNPGPKHQEQEFIRFPDTRLEHRDFLFVAEFQLSSASTLSEER